jgi:hypothetical protein
MPTEDIKNNPPKGLFSRIIKRFSLEVQLKTTRFKLGMFGTTFMLFFVLAIVTIFSLKEVLTHSGFGNYLNLIFSDPVMVLKYHDSFAATILETVPGASFFVFLLVFGILLLFIKYAAFYLEKLLNLIKEIRNNTYAKSI